MTYIVPVLEESGHTDEDNLGQLKGIGTEQGLTSHQSHYRSHWEQVFTGQMTQPTVSKHWRKTGPSGPSYRAHHNTRTMQYETKTHKLKGEKG